ncbi:hypothetical protein CampHawk_63 [Bacillus phage CampHawk]|uniref:Uncharacterized protein n=1 Tax=Bacillus phage CampHawk TaxID=1406783 RepID=U5PT53_9CAUD|nr:hypothetical protein CampHawk_63 [Bacillus phage CampHawk]AGY46941.1 hypothetical protein CampHawk_63 [Bacillus phage CampHawk]
MLYPLSYMGRFIGATPPLPVKGGTPMVGFNVYNLNLGHPKRGD